MSLFDLICGLLGGVQTNLTPVFVYEIKSRFKYWIVNIFMVSEEVQVPTGKNAVSWLRILLKKNKIFEVLFFNLDTGKRFI